MNSCRKCGKELNPSNYHDHFSSLGGKPASLICDECLLENLGIHYDEEVTLTRIPPVHSEEFLDYFYEE